MGNVRLFCYKMKDDAGFAPNPFHGLLTLANCKPLIRKHKAEGDWIAGFTSKALNGDKVGEERLIYLMKVTKKITYEEYWNNSEYECKKPVLEVSCFEERAGDNIYKPNIEIKSDYYQLKNQNHTEEHKEHDLKGIYVLVSNQFYYFGNNPIEIPHEIRPSIPKAQSAHGNRTYELHRIEQFINYVESMCPHTGMIDMPHLFYKLQNAHIQTV
jgi:hypothetical protein